MVLVIECYYNHAGDHILLARTPSKKNLSKTIVINDREQAIKTAFSIAQSSDIILVAGKGHEKFQEINGVKTAFDDKEKILELIKQT